MAERIPAARPERRAVPRGTWVGALLHPVYGLLRFIGAHVRDFYAAIGAFLLLGLALLIGAVLGFSALAEEVAEGDVQRVDDAVLLWMNGHANPTLDAAALEITALGGVVVVWTVILISSVFLWQTKHRWSVFLLAVAVLGGNAINFTLKGLFDRPRPQLFEWRTPFAPHSSFPSGHSTTAVVLYITLAYLLARLEPSRAMRRLTLGVAGVLVVLIGASRVYLGVHHPSDVLAGFALGLAWATFCALGIEAIRFFRTKKPEVARQEKGLEKGTAPLQDAVTGGDEGGRTVTP
jgi:undecaprenyl-diphosphatase